MNLTEVLDQLEGSDLTSVLLHVMSNRSATRDASQVLRQYEHDRFTRPASIRPRAQLHTSLAAVDALDADFEFVEASPLAPLGTHSTIAGVSQHRVVTTVRSTEVAADPTVTLALEAALRRRADRQTDGDAPSTVRLASIARVVRAQRFSEPDAFAHFVLLGLVTAGRDHRSTRFASTAVQEHVAAIIAVCRANGHEQMVVRLTDFSRRNSPLLQHTARSIEDPDIRVIDDPERPSGRHYYESICFKLSIVHGDEEVEVADGGLVDWVATLLSDRKERTMTSGLSLERLMLHPALR